MATVKEIKEVMSNRGFSECMRGMNGDKVHSITFTTNLADDYSYACTVYPESEEFQLQYAVPKSINVLQTPKCGSVLNDDHFKRINKKFHHHVVTLFINL